MDISTLPTSNSGIGFHYYPDDLHYRKVDLNAWLPELIAMRVSWLTLRSQPERGIPEAFIKGILDAGIEPIVHIRPNEIQRLDLNALALQFTSYARWGVRFVVVFDRPNARDAWSGDQFGRVDLVERFLEIWLPIVELAQQSGIASVLPPLEQGGTYWDTSFITGVIKGLQRRGKQSLLDELIISCYSFSGLQKQDYGAGGPAVWKESKPYQTPASSQDQLGFRSFEWYAAAVEAILGAHSPILMLAGGARLGEMSPSTGEIVDVAWHASTNLTIAREYLAGNYPDYLLNVNFWLLAAEANEPDARAAWFHSDGAVARAVAEFKTFARRRRQTRSEKRNKGVDVAAGGAVKVLKHYLLLPRYEGVASGWHWNFVGDIVRTYQPTCGYSPEEARHARHVTLIGDERGISQSIEEQLIQAGCSVERISSDDPVVAHKEITTAALNLTTHNGNGTSQ